MNDYRACGLYVRVSTDRQAIEGESHEEQEYRLSDFCRQRNWHVVEVYCEEGRLVPVFQLAPRAVLYFTLEESHSSAPEVASHAALFSRA